jgi:hypothetical protein
MNQLIRALSPLVAAVTAALSQPAIAQFQQQGAILVGTGAVGSAGQGQSVAVSADGNTALVGGPGDNSNAGAAWVFTRSGGVWSQQGGKLVGSASLGARGARRPERKFSRARPHPLKGLAKPVCDVKKDQSDNY